MSARCPTPRDLFRSGLLAACLTLLVVPAHAGMIGLGSRPSVVAIGDLNQDGYGDLVSGTYGDSTVSVALGRGNGRFKPKVQYSCGSSIFAVTLADLNGDSHLDVVSCCPNIGKVGIRFGAGDGTLGPRTDYSVNSPMGVVVRDVSEDGLPDLVLSSTSPSLIVMFATAPGTYGPQATYPGANSRSLDVGDLNNDGNLDVVAANYTGNGFNVYLSTSTPGTYGPPVSFSLQDAVSSLALADFNHDGALDVAAAIGNFNTVNVRLGLGNGTFGPASVYSTGATAPNAITTADFNGDTHADLAVTAEGQHTVTVMLGTGTGSFQPRVNYPVGQFPKGLAAGQLDGDANLDLAVAATESNSICTLSGNGNGTFQVPSGPVYVWGPVSGVATDPNSWLPARNSPTAADILVFNRGGAVTASSIPTTSVGQVVISGGTAATLYGIAFGAQTLTVLGGNGEDAVIEEESKILLNNFAAPLTVNMASGALGSVYGDLEISAASRFQALSTNGIVFWSTGRAIIGPGSTTTPFGNGTGASGDRSVFFQYGSRYIAQTPVSVFGTTPFPSQVVTMGPGSRFRMDVAFNQDVADRQFGDIEYNATGGSSLTGNGTFLCDSLIVNQGTLSVELTNNISIRGNIVLPACSGPSGLRFVPPSPANYYFEGDIRQHVYSRNPDCNGTPLVAMYASPNVTWNVNNDAGVDFSGLWRTSSNIHFRHGNIGSSLGWQMARDSSSVVTNASQSTGWFEMGLTRRVSANGPLRFDVGDSANYLPFDIDVRGVTKAGYVTAGNYAYDPYDFGNSQLDENHHVHRSPYLHASANYGNAFPPNFFGDLDVTFSFLPSDVDPGSDPLQFEARNFFYPPFPWRATTTGARTATSFQALGVTQATVDSFVLYAIGLPVTPSLSIANASSAEGNGSGGVAPVADALVVPMVQASSAQFSDGEGVVLAPWRSLLGRGGLSATAAHAMRVQSPGSLAFRVRLSQAAIVPVSVDYATADGTATTADGDYTPASGTLTFAPGDTALDIVVPFGADATPERNETFGITLSNASNATIDTPAATGTILDDDDLVAPTAHVTYPNGGEVIHQNQQVNLQWTASDNVAVSGVDIQILNGGTVTTLASNYPNIGSYQWLSTGPASIKMKFRVVAHDDPGHATTDNSDANWEISPYTIGVEDDVPLAFALPSPSPNPSPAGSSRITFAVPHEAQVRLTVHDVRGRKVATLANGTVAAGRHVRVWDSGSAGAGVYFLHFEAPGFRADRRLVVVR